MDSISKANKKKYKQFPTIEMMRQKTIDVKMNYTQFANHYGISSSFFRMVLAGMKRLPYKYWHIFYETEENTAIFLQEPEKQVNKSKKVATHTKNFNHGRLAGINRPHVENEGKNEHKTPLC